nr:MAG TPA: hypothetical protein [Caudoviricetes sp.]
MSRRAWGCENPHGAGYEKTGAQCRAGDRRMNGRGYSGKGRLLE